MADLKIHNLKKSFDGNDIIKGIDLDIRDREFVVFVGPSGCGKSTLLRLIAGLEEVSGGRIELDGRDITDVSPAKRDLAMVFQTYALYPHMTVRKNIAYPLRARRKGRCCSVAQRRISWAIRPASALHTLTPEAPRRAARSSHRKGSG